MIATTRAVPIPVIHDDDTIVVDDPDLDDVTEVTSPTMLGIPVAVGRDRTQDLDMTLRQPGEVKFHVLAGFTAGASTDVIADGIAAGERWVSGSVMLARDWLVLVDLSDPAVPRERRMAAWRKRP